MTLGSRFHSGRLGALAHLARAAVRQVARGSGALFFLGLGAATVLALVGDPARITP